MTKIFCYLRFCHILMVSIMSKELLVKQMLRSVLCECAFRTWCMSNFFFLMNIFDLDAKLSKGPFSAVYHKTITSAKIPGLIGRKEFILHSRWELKVKLTKLPKVQKYVVTKFWLVLVLNLIGWESGLSFLTNHHQGKVQSWINFSNQSKRALIYNSQILC